MNRILFRKKLLFWGVGIFLLWQMALGDSGKISIQSTVDQAKITIGDVITYTVTVTHVPEIKVKLPQLAENLGQFEIRDYHVFDPVKQNGKIINRVQYKISTFDVGTFLIPPIAVQYVIPPDSSWHTLKSETIKIEVESLAPSAEGDIKDIKPPVELPIDWKPIMRYGVAGLLVLLLLAAGLYFWWRRKTGKPLIPQKMEPPRPPHEVALEALERLAQKGLPDKNAVKSYYSEISEILRRYITGRFGIDAMDLTSSELLEELQTVSLNAPLSEKFRDFIELSDLVKFAKYRPTDEKNAHSLEVAIEFVNETKVVAVPETPQLEEPTAVVEQAESEETISSVENGSEPEINKGES